MTFQGLSRPKLSQMFVKQIKVITVRAQRISGTLMNFYYFYSYTIYATLSMTHVYFYFRSSPDLPPQIHKLSRISRTSGTHVHGFMFMHRTVCPFMWL